MTHLISLLKEKLTVLTGSSSITGSLLQIGSGSNCEGLFYTPELRRAC